MTAWAANQLFTLRNSNLSVKSNTPLVLSGGLGIAKNITIGGTAVSAASWTTSGIQYNSLATTYTNTSTASSGTATSATITSFAQPTIAASNATVTTTNAATVYIANAPTAGTNMTITNAYSLWIPNGKVLFDAAISSTTQTNGTLVVSGDMGLGGTLNADSVHLVSGGTINQTLANQSSWLSIQSDNTTWLDGSFSLLADFYGNSGVRAAIQCHNSTSATSTNSVFFGSMTNNDLRLGTNDSTRMTILGGTNAGRVGIGTTSPAAQLDVSGSVSQTIDSGGLGYGQLSKTSTTFTVGPVSSVAISIKSSNSILVSSGSYYTTSDRRLKTNIQDIDDTTAFIRNVSPKLFAYKSNSERQELGYIAQDVAKYAVECISFIQNDYLQIEQAGDMAGYQLTLDYDKIACLLHKCLQSVLNRLDALEDKGPQ